MFTQHPLLRLYEDTLANPPGVDFRLPALPRVIYVVAGTAVIGDHQVGADEVWQGEDAVMVRAGAQGVTCWRWELCHGDLPSAVASSPGLATREKLSASLQTLPGATF